MTACGSSVSYLQGSAIGWTPQGCLCKHQWKRGVVFTCIHLLVFSCPGPSEWCLLKCREELSCRARARGLQGLSQLGREAGLFHRQSRAADEQKDNLRITEHILITEVVKNPRGVGEKERIEQGRCWHQQWLCALRVLWTGQPKQDTKESSHNTGGDCSCFIGIFKSVYGMISVEWLCWKQFRGGMLLLGDFFKLQLDTYSYISARNEPQQLFRVHRGVMRSEAAEKASATWRILPSPFPQVFCRASLNPYNFLPHTDITGEE